jgi:hypothetical protein
MFIYVVCIWMLIYTILSVNFLVLSKISPDNIVCLGVSDIVKHSTHNSVLACVDQKIKLLFSFGIINMFSISVKVGLFVPW